MKIFPVNQVNQAYVCKVLKEKAAISDPGDFAFSFTPDDELYVTQMGAGGLVRSDLVDVKNILWARYTTAEEMARPLKKVEVTLNPEINEGKPVGGQDYILRIAFENYIGISPEDSTYWKYGMVRAHATMTASDFYKKLALSIAKNMSREAVQLVKIYLNSVSAANEVTPQTKEASLSGEYTKVIIKEAEQDWILGLKQEKPVKFTVSPGDIEYVDGDFVSTDAWGVVVEGTDGTVPNGKLMADYEYFTHGERGDDRRFHGWPDVTFTQYLVNPTQEYSTVGIHYYYVGDNQSVQKSEKDLTLIIPKAAAAAVVEQLNSLLEEKNASATVKGRE